MELVERLRAATRQSVFSSLGETAAVGKVSAESVRPQRVSPMMSNSFEIAAIKSAVDDGCRRELELMFRAAVNPSMEVVGKTSCFVNQTVVNYPESRL